MKDLVNIPVLFLVLFCMSTAYCQVDSNQNEIEAKINLETKDRLLNISGHAINNTMQAYQLRYELSVITGNINNSNSSKKEQSGSSLLLASATKMLSNTSISNNPVNSTIIKLDIFKNDKVIVRDSMIFYCISA